MPPERQRHFLLRERLDAFTYDIDTPTPYYANVMSRHELKRKRGGGKGLEPHRSSEAFNSSTPSL